MQTSKRIRPARSKPLWTAGAVALAAYAVCSSPIVSYDFWWHLAAGEWMIAHRAVLTADPFSHTMNGVPWIDFEWLFQVLLAGAHKAGGFSLIAALKGIFAAGAVALLVASCRTAGAGSGGAALAAALLLPLLRARTFARPELATLVLLPAFVLLIHRARNSRTTAPLLPAIILGALWANLHGGFIYGAGLLLLAEIGSRASGCREKPHYGWVAVAVLAAALINPYGWKIYSPLVSHLADLASPAASGIGAIQEWARTGLGDAPVFWILLAAGWGVVVRDWGREDGEVRFWAPALLVFGLWGAAQVRNPVLYAFICLPVLAARVSPQRAAGFAAAGLLVFSLWGTHARRSSPVRWERLPRGAADFLESTKLDGKTFTDYEFGGYWDWRFSGKRPGFFDGRYLFHGLLAKERIARETPGAFSDFLGSNGIELAVAGYGRENFPPRFPRDRWALIYWDDAAMVYLKRPVGAQVQEFRLTDPEHIDFYLEEIRAGRLDRIAALDELARHRRETGFTVRGEVLTQAVSSLQ